MTTLAQAVEDALAKRGGIVLDDRRLPLFRLGARVREGERSATFLAEVVDSELLEQGAPKDVVLQILSLPELPADRIARALEPCLLDHPRVQLVHSVALPVRTLAAVQPSEPSPLLPPLNSLPLCDDLGVLVLVQESTDGVPLLKWRKLRGSELKLSELSDLLETTSEALASLHRRGFAHGTLTPESITLQEFISPTMVGQAEEHVWVPKVVDLGLSRTLAPAGAWPGSAAALWCAPEAFAPDQHTDWRKVDQLGLAALLYALWTDRIPFEAIPAGTSSEQAKLLRRQQIEALPPPRGNQHARALGVTPAMSAACMRALSPEPADRFASMDAFAVALRSASRDAGRRSRDEDSEDPPTGTSPQSGISSRFRTLSGRNTDSAKVRTSAPEGATDPGGPTKSEPPAAPEAEEPAKAEAAPAEAPTEPPPPKRASYAPPPVATSELQLFPGGGAKPPPTEVRADPEESKTPAKPVNTPFPTEPGRRTKILAAPEKDEGSYPPHPDREPAPTPEPAEPEDLAAAFGAKGPWAFNHLAATLLVLWLATLAWAVLRSPAPAAEHVAGAAAKAGTRTTAAEDQP